MYPDSLVFGIVDAPVTWGASEVEGKLRDLTISWSRYDYRGRILDGTTIDDVLRQADALGYDWCLIQTPGHVILESWHADGGPARFAERIADLLARDEGAAAYQIDDQCVVVDVHRYRTVGRHPVGTAAEVDPGLADCCLSLGADRHRLAPYLCEAVRGFRVGDSGMGARTEAFLENVRRQVVNATRGVFLWNLEPYDDVRTPPEGFEPPISTLYSVAAGFKPNVVLESLGFDEDTRVVYFDYSRRALETKRLLLEEWDGSDFPAFVRTLFARLPHPATYYHLWGGATPETLDPPLLDEAWSRELELWGGGQRFREHWAAYRRLAHEFVHCDVLRDPEPLLDRVDLDTSAVIWWSNAFFSMSGNWLFGAEERSRRYELWVNALADRNPGLFLYGSDVRNSSVNHVQAGDYRDLLMVGGGDELVPLKASASEIRF